MTERRKLIHTAFLYLLPILVSWYWLDVSTTVAAVLFVLAWRWIIVLSGIVVPPTVPELELESISASHFVEKVRWCMDRLGVDYHERPVGGTLGVFFTGRSVPQLKIKTGLVRSILGNSPDILRYLWGRYSATLGAQAAFLEPTPERLELEQRIDRYGVDLQIWIYFHVLPSRDLTLHVWGCNNPAIPAWQRGVLRLLFPVLRFLVRRAFQISVSHYARAVLHIEALLGDFEERLADGRHSILGGDETNYVDITFAAMTGLWLQPAAYGAGKADAVRPSPYQVPSDMRTDIERWQRSFPHAVAFVERLYEEERRLVQ